MSYAKRLRQQTGKVQEEELDSWRVTGERRPEQAGSVYRETPRQVGVECKLGFSAREGGTVRLPVWLKLANPQALQSP